MVDTTFAAEYSKASFDGTLTEAIKSGRARSRTYSGTNWTTSVGTVTAGANVSTNVGFTVSPGFRFLLTSLTLSADAECIVRTRISPDNGSTWYSKISNQTASNNLQGYLEVDTIVPASGGDVVVNIPAGLVIPENSSLTNLYATSGTVARRVAYVASGYEIPLDYNPQASVRIAVGLDSNTANANLGNDPQGRAYLGRDTWHSKLVSSARTAGIDAGLWANWAQDGRTYEEFAYSLITGQWGGNWDRLILLGGTNDAASTKYTLASAPNQLPDWIQAIVDWRDQFYPNQDKRILFCGPINTDDPDRTGLDSNGVSRIVGVRNAIATKVAALKAAGRTKIDYLDASLAFPLAADQTTDVNYKSQERVAGQTRVHMSGVGSTLLGSYIFAQKRSFLFDPL